MRQPYINDVFVSVEPDTGTLRRYAGGVMSHEAVSKGVAFTPGMVEGFRVRPDRVFALSSAFHPLPTPPDGSPQAAMAA